MDQVDLKVVTVEGRRKGDRRGTLQNNTAFPHRFVHGGDASDDVRILFLAVAAFEEGGRGFNHPQLKFHRMRGPCLARW